MIGLRTNITFYCFRFFFLLIGLTSLGITNLNSQHLVKVLVNSLDSAIISDTEIYPDSTRTENRLKATLSKLQEKGYLEASFDLKESIDSLRVYNLHLGKPYSWLELINHNMESDILESAGINLHTYKGKKINLTELKRLKNRILTAYENHGYPFANIWNDHIVINNNNIKADLLVDKGHQVRYEEIVVDGPVKISNSYLSSYLGIEIGSIYNRKELDEIDDKLSQLSFLSLSGNPRVFFNYEKARLELPLKKKKSSKFDFILGLQPNQGNAGTGVSLTGIFLGDFINQLGQGERFYLGFKRLGPLTQELDLTLNYPYLLKTSFGVDGTFDLYKRDTSFVNLNAELGIQFLLNKTNYLKAFWNNKSTNLSNINADNVVDNSQNDLDTRFSNFGLELYYQNLNHPISPTKGYYINTRMSIGTRTVKLNQQILESNASFYENIDPSVFQLLTTADLQYFIPTGKRSTLQLRSRIGWLQSESTLFRNELFRIGGNQILRGFDNEAFFASRYVVGTAEYRYILGTNRYFFVFADGAYVQEDIGYVTNVDFPVGLGTGIRFQTEAGIFSLTYGVGSRNDESFDFNKSKIHFGYVNLF